MFSLVSSKFLAMRNITLYIVYVSEMVLYNEKNTLQAAL